jgi:hypothetical protein
MNFEDPMEYVNLKKAEIIDVLKGLDQQCKKWEEKCENEGRYGKMLVYIAWIGDGWHAPTKQILA